MSNVKLKYDELVAVIGTEFSTLIAEINSATDDWSKELAKMISGVEIFVDDEQSFVKRVDLNNNNIYIVVKFGNASTNFGSSVCPANLMVFGTKNKIKPTQFLLSAFVARWNLQNFPVVSGITLNSALCSQVWSTPTVVSNFNTISDGFENLFNVSGSLIIGQSVLRISSVKYIVPGQTAGTTDELPLDIISFNTAYDCALAPQPFGNTCGFTKSEANFSTESFTISTYLLDNQFVNDCLSVQGYRKRDGQTTVEGSKGPNDDFKFVITFSNGYDNKPKSGETATNTDPVLGKEIFMTFKLKSVSIGQRIGELPSLTVAFTH